jgi:hypothetical protein
VDSDSTLNLERGKRQGGLEEFGRDFAGEMLDAFDVFGWQTLSPNPKP